MNNRPKSQPEGIQIPDNTALDAGMTTLLAGMFGQLLGSIITNAAIESERAYQSQIREKEINYINKINFLKSQSHQNTPTTPTSSTNPYRSGTVQDVEAMLLSQPASPQRESMLRELAKYPESMPVSQLPTQTVRYLTGK